jgi:hypothetical protein
VSATDWLKDLLGGRKSARANDYDEAREQLGGAPFLKAPKSTDAWFALNPSDAPAGSSEAVHRRRVRIAYATVGVVALGFAVITLVGKHRTPPAAAIAAPTATAPAPAPTPTPPPSATATAPAPTPAPVVAPDEPVEETAPPPLARAVPKAKSHRALPHKRVVSTHR